MINVRTKIRLWSVAIFAASTSVIAQDAGWVRTWEQAQRSRPASIASTGRIAPVGEPGLPLVVHGRVYRSDGRTPASGIVVFAYQTDAAGVYNRNNRPGWRLRGWTRTDASGRFTFRTIRPAPYPKSRMPAHIHMTVEGPGVPRRWTPELNFADDRFVPDAAKRNSERAGAFGSVRPVTTRDGTQHVDFHIRLTNDGRF